jgi:signal transduction histidine kinase
MGFSYDLTSVFTLWDAPAPPVDFDGIRMEAYQPSVAGPVFVAVGNRMVRVKHFRWARFKYNVYQFSVLYGSPVVCIIPPLFIFGKHDDWTWWVGLFLMLNFWIWIGGVFISTFISTWAMGLSYGVRQNPALTMKERARTLFKVFFSFDWDIPGQRVAARDLEPAAPDAVKLEGLDDVLEVTEHKSSAAVQAALAKVQEQLQEKVAALSIAEERARLAEAQVVDLEDRLRAGWEMKQACIHSVKLTKLSL